MEIWEKRYLAKYFVHVFIPLALMYLGISPYLNYLQKDLNYIGAAVGIEKIKNVITTIGVLYSMYLYGYKTANLETTAEQLGGQRDALLRDAKSKLLNMLKKEFGNFPIIVDVRIYLPDNRRKTKLTKLLKECRNIISKTAESPRITFISTNIAGLTQYKCLDNVVFEVSPLPQGLVGKCFNDPKLLWEENFKAKLDKYNLTDFQKQSLRELRFMMCCPIWNSDEKLVAIIQLSSEQKAIITNNQNLNTQGEEPTWADIIQVYCSQLYQVLPEIFKS